MRLIRGVLAIAVVLVALPVAGSAAQAAACAGPADGGDWPGYGNTPDNARHQTAPGHAIDASNAADVATAWSFSPADHEMTGTFSNTPIVTGGCVYLATSTGWVAAVNADTGELVWKTDGPLPGDGIAWHANVISGSPTVVGGAVYVGVNRTGSPYVAALDRATGDLLWTRTIATLPSNTTVATPVYHEGLIFQGFSGFEFEPDARGGYGILDASPACSEASATTCANPVAGATGGELLVHRYTIGDDDYEAGYRGAGVWCTAAVDVETSYAYACTSNPAREREHELTNSLLKVDLDRSRETFGDIVGAYKGNPDNYAEGLNEQPACEEFGEVGMPYYSIPCFQLDSDFGASPHLFRDSEGRLIVGDLQKSGVYHAADADTMDEAWRTVIGPPCIWCNAASPAHDGEQIYTVSGLASKMFALDRAGGYRWTTPVANTFHYQPVSVAKGVAYTINGWGTVLGLDTETGVPVFAHSIAAATETPMAEVNSGGVAIARSTIYAAANEYVFAYRLP